MQYGMGPIDLTANDSEKSALTPELNLRQDIDEISTPKRRILAYQTFGLKQNSANLSFLMQDDQDSVIHL